MINYVKVILIILSPLLIGLSVSASQLKQAPSPTAALIGIVTDQFDAHLAEAAITVSRKGKEYRLVTSKEGTYQVALPPGIYRVEVRATGFKPFIAEEVEITEGMQVRDFRLAVANPICTVQVVAPTKKVMNARKKKRQSK